MIEKRRHEEPRIEDSLTALSKVLTLGILIVMLFLLHDITGLSLTTVLAFGGVGGLAVAIASQEMVQIFFWRLHAPYYTALLSWRVDLNPAEQYRRYSRKNRMVSDNRALRTTYADIYPKFSFYKDMCD